jgi:hypothetical protein
MPVPCATTRYSHVDLSLGLEIVLVCLYCFL